MVHRLTVLPLDEVIEVEDGQTMLDACLRAGVWLPHACGHGLCSTCKVHVEDGEIELGDASPFALMDFERDEGYALACTARLRTDVTIEADLEDEPDAERHPVRDFVGTVRERELVSRDIVRLRLDVPEGIAFQAGQYVNVSIPSDPRPRAFSIASSPSSPHRIELHVRKVPGGRGTEHLHGVSVGDELCFSGPYGRFYVRKSQARPLIFLAGGSGLSSVQSMVLDLLEGGYEEEILVLHGVRTPVDRYHEDLFAKLAEEYPNLEHQTVLSEAADEHDAPRGYVHEHLATRYDGRFAGRQAYLCGPPAMIEACIRTLMKGRLFERDIFTERFITAADGQAALARSPLFKKL